jgi:predicted PurR-regulated permease PerM
LLHLLEGLVLIVVILIFGKHVLVPLALAVLLTFILNPIVVRAQRAGLPRLAAVLVVATLAFGLLTMVGWGVGSQVRRLAEDLPAHTKEIKEKVATLRSGSNKIMSGLVHMIEEVSAAAEPAPLLGPAPKTDDRPLVFAESDKSSGFERLLRFGGAVAEPLATSVLIIVLVLFMLIKREDLRNRMLSLVGHGRLTDTTRLVGDAADRISTFLLTQLFVNTGFGIAFGLGLFLIGVPYALLWAFLTAVLRFVPYVGSWIALAFPLLLSFAMSPTWSQPLLLLGMFALLDLVCANVIEPLLFGHRTGVAPIALLVAAVFWSWVWGPIGLVLSTPLTVCLVVLGQHVPQLRFLALLLGTDPPLAEHASFYQRLLVRDQAEATEIARTHGAEHGLAKAYDEVVMPALSLVRKNRRSEAISSEEEEAMYETTRAIVDGLPARLSPSAPAVTDASVAADAAATTPPRILLLGCPAQHETDEIALRMVARVLEPDGWSVDILPTRALPIEIEDCIADEPPAAIFISALPPGGLLPAVQLCRRLRRRDRRLPVIVGYWGRPRQIERLIVALRSAGASYVTTSVAQTRNRLRSLMPGLRPAKATPAEPAGV